MASNLAGSIEPNAFLKSIYRMYMSWLVKQASSSAAINVCNCLAVPRLAQKPSWLSCRIWYFSPYEDNIEVNELVKSLYMVIG